jgi:mRNA interferase MazF
MALTSVDQGEGTQALQDWKDAGLVKPTWVKPLLATVDMAIVEKRLGRLSERDRRSIADSLREVMAGEFLC